MTIKFPRLPRNDPDHEPESHFAKGDPLATSGWQPTQRVIEALAYQENDPDMQNAVYLTKLPDGRLLGFNDKRNIHMVTLASSGSGKTATLITPVLLTYRGSIIVIDPKGELASTTYRQRQKFGQKVIVIDPFRRARVPDEMRGSLNPLASIGINQKEVIERVGALADSIIIKGDPKSRHFDEGARSFIKAVILYILTIAEKEETEEEKAKLKSMALLRELVTSGINGSLDELCAVMMKTGGKFGSAIAAGAGMIANTTDAERSGMVSTISRNTEFLDSPDIQAALESNTIDPSKIKEEPTTIYLVLPEEYLEEYGRYLRLMLTVFLNAIKQTPAALHPKTGEPMPPVLFILEELASLGYMPQIERAAGLLRSFGARLWFIWQDINQAKSHYPNSYDSLIGNAGIVTAFGNADNTTLEYLSKRLGQCQVSRMVKQENWQKGENTSSGGFSSVVKEMEGSKNAGSGLGGMSRGKSEGHSTSHSQQLHTVPLMQPDEIARYFSAFSEIMLVSIAGAQPIRLPRIAAHKDEEFRKRLAPNPFHPQAAKS